MSSASAFIASRFREFNTNVIRNSGFASTVSALRYFPRLVHNDLSGYLLGGYGGTTATEPEAVFQWITRQTNLKRHTSLLVTLFIEKPDLIKSGETYTVLMRSQEFFTQDSHKERNLGNYHYKLEIRRTVPKTLNLVLYRDLTTEALSLNFPENGGENYIYVTFTVGSGVLFFTSKDDVRAKFYEMLTVYRSGETTQRELATFYKKTEEKKIKMTTEGQFSSPRNIWMRVEYQQSTNPTLNELGLRVQNIDIVAEVIPPQVMGTLKVQTEYPSCFLEGLKEKLCLGMSMLESPSEVKETNYRVGIFITRPDFKFQSQCKALMSHSTCLIALPGFIGFHTDTNHLFTGPGVHESRYEEMDQKYKDFYFLFTSNTGRKYLIPCPPSCKLILIPWF